MPAAEKIDPRFINIAKEIYPEYALAEKNSDIVKKNYLINCAIRNWFGCKILQRERIYCIGQIKRALGIVKKDTEQKAQTTFRQSLGADRQRHGGGY